MLRLTKRDISKCHRFLFGLHNSSSSYYSNGSTPVGFLKRPNDIKIAYISKPSSKLDLPGVMYLAGFQSNMLGVKATAIDEYCTVNDVSYVRFDYRGIGQSNGDIRDVTLTDCKSDALAVLDELTAGPQILIGSSMGALLMFHLAMLRPHRVQALIGISAASYLSQFPRQILEDVRRYGEAHFEEESNSYVVTRAFLEDAQSLSIAQPRVFCPVRLLHGLQDRVIPHTAALDLAQSLPSHDVIVLCRKSADHRFSQPEDIQLLFETLNSQVNGTDRVHDLALRAWAPFTVYSRAHIVSQPDVADARSSVV